MIMEMVDSEPPFFNEPPLMAMKKIRDQAPPILKDPDKVKYLFIYFRGIFLVFAEVYTREIACSVSIAKVYTREIELS